MNEDALVVYQVNSQDEIVYLNETWQVFALANDAADLAPEKVLGRPLWDFITDETTKVLYREILQHVRAGRATQFQFRCDAPAYRRYMEMTVTAQPGGEVQFASSLAREEARPPQEILNRFAARSEEWLRICGWCKRVDVTGRGWEAIEQAVSLLHLFGQKNLPRLTHGMCENCYQGMLQQVAELRAIA